ncbi:hypothetical protein [Phaeobacter porticola]|uniref:Uncharacterized protein n=1 Tax=Phaeobacter porticola TaxID=1844006 RepID=A0A1L3I1A3_9RHOB|nr:hypothetical protein [Phaeobacter porticola]APG45896.1 hypothetical protein PhaeoP97_00447 [Phaeobacter porticola]
MSDHFFVVTGGSGAGKTSLITGLVSRRTLHECQERVESSPKHSQHTGQA